MNAPRETSHTLELVLPYPISANRYWQSHVPKGWTRAVVHVSSEGAAYKRQVKQLAHQAGVEEPFVWRVAVEIELYPQLPEDWERRRRKNPAAWDDTVRCIDLTNAEKVLLDALNGVVFFDDKWIWEYRARRMVPDGEARVVLRVTPLEVPVMPLFAAEKVEASP